MPTKQPTNKPEPPTRHIRPRTRQISLAFMGDEFTACHLDVRYLTWADTERISQENEGAETNGDVINGMIATVKRVFYSGRILDAEGDLIEMTAAHIDEFDLDSLRQVFEATMGIDNPKGSGQESEPPFAENLADDQVSTGA